MRIFKPSARHFAVAVLVCLGASALSAAEPPAANKGTEIVPGWNLPDFIDQLPDLLVERLPIFEPTGALRLYVRPHFGDFLHRDYVRVPFGARDKVTEDVECSAELQTYFTHGLGDAAGYGLSGLQLGAKREHFLPSLGNGGVSVGTTFQTPLSRPPVDLTDGYRHFQPYVAATYPIVDGWHVLGFASVAGDFLNRTALPAHFGRNQLHANSLMFSAGAAREFKWFHASLTASVTTSALTSDESKQVYALRPEIVVPWKVGPNSKSHILFTLGGRAVHGPDGTELGVSGSMRIELVLKPGAK